MLLFLTIALPMLGGAAMGLMRFSSAKSRGIYVETIVLATSILTWVLLLTRTDTTYVLCHMNSELALAFRVDGMSCIFAGLVSILWPLASLYGFEYMQHEERPNTFFSYYTMSYAVTLAVAFSAMAARGTPKSAVRRFVASARSRYPIGRARRAAKISPALVMSDTSLGCTRAGISRHPSIRHAISRRLPSTMIYPCAAARTRIGSRSPSRAIDAASVSSGICESDFCCTLGLSAICSVGSSAISVCAHCA